MAQMLLINPRKRRTTAKKARRVSTKRKTARRTKARSYAPNPISVAKVKRRIRRPVRTAKAVSRRRRRNPIGSARGLNMRGITSMLKDAFIGGAGAVSIDLLMARVNTFLPASLQPTAQPGMNNAIKAGLTVVLGQALSKATRGMSHKMAAGALAVQAADVVRYALARYMPAPALPAPATGTEGVGYATPAYVTNGSARVGPAINGVGRRMNRNTPLLSRFTSNSPVLSGANTARMRESVMR